MNIREARTEDIEKIFALTERLDSETNFMAFEPGERRASAKLVNGIISSHIKNGHSLVLLAEEEEELAGFLMATGSSLKRRRHWSYLILGILQEHVGKGLGTRLMQEMETWARRRDIRRVELTVMRHNDRAIKLYKKMGFEIEGIKRDSLFVGGQFVDEYYMGKLLETD